MIIVSGHAGKNVSMLARCWQSLCALTVSILIFSGATAEESPRLLGAATCGTATCHAAPEPWANSAVSQNEFNVWRDRDPHSDAWQTLTSAKSRDIARLMGIADPTVSEQCLDCHATRVGPGGAEPNFDIQDGVSCEGCHGPASSWLGVHTSGLYFYNQNLQKGLYPTADPQKRAELCVSCHVGSPDNFITHQMMAAGHPLMDFQLGFHTLFQEEADGQYSTYAHFTIDDDYLQRKPRPFGLKALLISEIVEWKQQLVLVNSHYTTPVGAFPELAFFDCYSCHFEINSLRLSGAVRGSPGYSNENALPFLIEQNFVLFDLAAEGLIDPDTHNSLKRYRSQLREAVSVSPAAVMGITDAMIEQLDSALVSLQSRSLSGQDERAMLRRIEAAISGRQVRDYMSARHMLYAVASIIDSLYQSGDVTEIEYNTARASLSRALSVKDRDVRNSLHQQQAITAAISSVAESGSQPLQGQEVP